MEKPSYSNIAQTKLHHRRVSIDGFFSATGIIAGFMLLLMFFGVSIAAISRYVFKEPIPWSVDISQYVLVWTTFLSTALLLKLNGHVRMDMILQWLPDRLKLGVELVNNLIGLGLFLVLSWYGSSVVYDHFIRGTLMLGSINVPYYLVLAVIPFGTILLIIEFCRRIRDEILSFFTARNKTEGLTCEASQLEAQLQIEDFRPPAAT